jgi:hypothetical protein
MPFRLEHITLAERVALGSACVLHAGEYGLITNLARTYGTSRQFWYRLRARAAAALTREFEPRPPGRPALARRLRVDRAATQRAVVVLHQVGHVSVRGIRECLAELYGVERSVGWVQTQVADGARRARALQPTPAGPLRVLADEVYAGHHPVLAVVDHASGLVAALEPVTAASETAWGCLWLDLAARGVTVADLAADGAHGLAAGARVAGLGQPRLDHWHALRDLTRITKRLEGEAYRRLAAAEHAARAAAESERAAATGRRRVGRPLKAPRDPAGVAALAQAAAEAIQRADGAATVRGWVQEVLRPVDGRSGQVRTAAAVVADLAAAAGLLRDLGGRAAAAAGPLQRHATGLAAYLEDLARALAGPRAALGPATVAFLAWAWYHRAALGVADPAAAWPADPAAAGWVWAALDGVVRGSGMVENLNSVLAFPRATRRGLPPTTLALTAVYRNHHRFARGKRAGQTPLELVGLPSPHWLEALGYGPPPTPPNFRPVHADTVTTMAA